MSTKRRHAWAVVTLLGAGPLLAAPPADPAAGARPSPMHAPPVSGAGRCPMMHDGAGGPGSWQGRMADLDLTPGQRGAIQSIIEGYRTRAWELAQRGSGLREQFMNTAPDDPQYADVTRQAAETAGGMAAEGVQLLGAMRAEIHAILTPEQRQRLLDQSRERSRRWDEWRERHRAPGR